MAKARTTSTGQPASATPRQKRSAKKKAAARRRATPAEHVHPSAHQPHPGEHQLVRREPRPTTRLLERGLAWASLPFALVIVGILQLSTWRSTLRP